MARKVKVKFAVLLRELDSLPVDEICTELASKLKHDVKRFGNAQLREEILESSEAQQLAGYVYAVAKEDLERVQDHFDRLMGEWALTARAELAELKEDGEWGGQVTATDVERHIASKFDDYGKAKVKLRTAKKIHQTAKILYEVFEKRLGSLQTYARLIEKRSGHSIKEHNARMREGETE